MTTHVDQLRERLPAGVDAADRMVAVNVDSLATVLAVLEAHIEWRSLAKSKPDAFQECASKIREAVDAALKPVDSDELPVATRPFMLQPPPAHFRVACGILCWERLWTQTAQRPGSKPALLGVVRDALATSDLSKRKIFAIFEDTVHWSTALFKMCADRGYMSVPPVIRRGG